MSRKILPAAISSPLCLVIITADTYRVKIKLSSMLRDHKLLNSKKMLMLGGVTFCPPGPADTRPHKCSSDS